MAPIRSAWMQNGDQKGRIFKLKLALRHAINGCYMICTQMTFLAISIHCHTVKCANNLFSCAIVSSSHIATIKYNNCKRGTTLFPILKSELNL